MFYRYYDALFARKDYTGDAPRGQAPPSAGQSWRSGGTGNHPGKRWGIAS
jgi:hypothetical protein